MTYRTITIDGGKKRAAQEAFGTVIHEMTHRAEDLGRFDSQKVFKAALKKLDVRSNSKDLSRYDRGVVGTFKDKDVGDPHEIIAFGIEKLCSGSQNKLANAIYEVLKEIGVIKQ